uniref:Structural maintenance of chromosomes protein 4 n=1 Tax=Mantoniella antarctica TaxID=81844 RepID=A0A7S0STF6_9CHLO
MERAIPKLRAEVAAAKERAVDLRGRLGELDAAAKTSKEDAAELKKLEREVVAATEALEQVQAGAAGIRARCVGLQEDMDSVGGNTLKKQRALVKDLAAGITAAGDAATEKRATAASHAKATARLTAAHGEDTAERTALTEDVKQVKEAFKALEDGALEVLESQKELKDLVEAKAKELAAADVALQAALQVVGTIKHVEVDIQAKLDDFRLASKENEDKARHWDKELAKLCKERAAAHGESGEPAPELLTKEELAHFSTDAQNMEAAVLEDELAVMKPDLASIDAFRTKEAEYEARAGELRGVTESRDATRGEYDDLRKRRLDEFMSGFNVISLRLKEMYQMITLGGDAELELVDSLDPFSEGIVFSVRPPKKSWKNIANLSGGEKTLSSLALVFALHHYKPTPLYVMDEIDAALDFKNVSIVGHYIKERTKDAQFIIISLRNNMFELADRLVGVYKTNNTTKTVAINPGAFTVGGAGGSSKALAAGGAGDEAPSDENAVPNAETAQPLPLVA